MSETDPSMTPAPTKPGFKTVGFYITALLTALGALAASGHDVGGFGAVGFVISSLGAAGYTAIRAFAKSDDPKKPAWRTSEFWLCIASAVVALVYASGAFVETSTTGKALALVASFLAALGYGVKPKADPA